MSSIDGEWFLWGGFVFSSFCFSLYLVGGTKDHPPKEADLILVLSGVSFCAFGYLLFS